MVKRAQCAIKKYICLTHGTYRSGPLQSGTVTLALYWNRRRTVAKFGHREELATDRPDRASHRDHRAVEQWWWQWREYPPIRAVGYYVIIARQDVVVVIGELWPVRVRVGQSFNQSINRHRRVVEGQASDGTGPGQTDVVGRMHEGEERRALWEMGMGTR